ncbi:hypothetical protein JHK85_007090 [Glycine max]|nr:hypothetical protein JHK85_007090 [Glycine max]
MHLLLTIITTLSFNCHFVESLVMRPFLKIKDENQLDTKIIMAKCSKSSKSSYSQLPVNYELNC